jgi:hypothetical protein
MKIIRHALDMWPGEFHMLTSGERAKRWRYYGEDIYRSLEL